MKPGSCAWYRLGGCATPCDFYPLEVAVASILTMLVTLEQEW